MANLEGEFFEENKHRAYPFVDDTYGLAFSGVDLGLDANSLFLDAYMVYQHNSDYLEPDEHWNIDVLGTEYASFSVVFITNVITSWDRSSNGRRNIADDYSHTS